MKRILSVFLIAFLLLVPLFSTQAESHIRVKDSMLSDEAIDRLEARADEVLAAHGVAPYFLFDTSVSDIVEYADTFVESVSEENAILLGLNATHYHFAVKGDLAKAAFPKSVLKDTLGPAFEAVKGDDEGKIRAYLDTVDEILAAYEANPTAAEPQPEPSAAAANIALTDSGKPTVVDSAKLLSDSEAEALSLRLAEIGRRYQCDVIVATVPDMGAKTAEQYADDFFDYNGYGYGATPDANGTTVDGDGILLFLSMLDRDFAVSTSGYGITAFTDYGIQEYLEPMFLPYFSRNDYDGGFNAYADGCEELLRMARDGMPYDCYHVYAAENTLDSAQLANANATAERFVDENGVAIYYLCFPSETDIGSFVAKFLKERVPESDALVLGVGSEGTIYQTKGSYAARRFTQKRLAALSEKIEPLLKAGNYYGAFETYTERSNRILHPLNLFTLAIAIGAGLLFGFIPLSGMKRQLVSVQPRTDADEYLIPSTFTLTQNSDVLLGSHVSRSVHVQPTESGGGPRGGGGGFHGGSSTHTSSSGGTHGGHSGKF